MQILQKRQTGESAIPASLSYGEIAIDKRGRLHTADETGTVVDPLEPALDAIFNTQYDVKMLQLEQILEKKEPPMLGGFIEAFGDTKKRYSATKCAVDTSAHRLVFNGLTETESSQSYQADGTETGGVTVSLQTVKATVARPAELVNTSLIEFNCEAFSSSGSPTYTGTIYGKNTPEETGTKLSVTFESQGAAKIFQAELTEDYAYYTFTLNVSAPVSFFQMTGKGDFYSLTSSGGSYPSIHCTLTGKRQSTSLSDGSYITKVIELGVPVESGEVYLHYPALPEGATLGVKLGTDTENHVALSPEGEERTVTLGSTTLKERKYLIPPFAEAVSGVSVRIDGHREKLEDVLAVSDICVAMR